MSLASLTPEDWRALAAVPEAAACIDVAERDTFDRWLGAGLIRFTHPRPGGWPYTITPFGQGVIAAARVLVTPPPSWSRVQG